MNEISLRFPEHPGGALPLDSGVHGIGRNADGTLTRIDDPAAADVCFCVDRRGTWLTVRDGVRGVHVNGRPVQRVAMLRVGDNVHVDGSEIALLGPLPPPPPAQADPLADGSSDPRVVLRGVGGRHHGRSFTLERPRLVGSSVDADLRIDDPAFAERHARISLQGDRVVLRDLGSVEGSIVNGQPVRDALLRTGDQIVFDAHHRFVVEAPAPVNDRIGPPPLPDDGGERVESSRQALGRSARRLPWLLLAALLLAAALSGLLLFGVAG